MEPGQARGRFFTRHPETGSKRVSAIVYLPEDGPLESTPLPLLALQQSFPQVALWLKDRASDWETEFKDAVEADFELSGGQLRLGGLRPLGREPHAALKIAVDLVREGLLSEPEALLRVEPEALRALLLPTFDPVELRQNERRGQVLGRGEWSCGGAVQGRLAFGPETAWRYLEEGHAVILVCRRLSYLERDLLPMVSGFLLAEGPLLAIRQFKKTCVLCSDLNFESGEALLSSETLSEGETLSLDGLTGQILRGAVKIVAGSLSAEASTLLTWADQVRRLEIRANVSSVEDVEDALDFGASGFGLCRMEALVQRPERLHQFQMALREICLGADQWSPLLEQFSRDIAQDLGKLFGSVQGPLPFALRLLDAPVSQMLRFWRDHTELPSDYFQSPMDAWLHELSPMQGLRCGRLSILFPLLLQLQIRTVLRAWQNFGEIALQILMPGVCDAREIQILRQLAGEVAELEGWSLPEIGSMLELPRACLTADLLAQESDFLTFGTGDLTEATCGLSRYDSQLSFLPGYLAQEIFPRDPFQAIDQLGVGALMRHALHLVKEKNPSLEMGTCGAQAVDEESLAFCFDLGLKYVSVPVSDLAPARLAAARAALRQELDEKA